MFLSVHIVVMSRLERCLVEIVLEEYRWIAKYYGQDDLRRYIKRKGVPQTMKPYPLERDVFYA